MLTFFQVSFAALEIVLINLIQTVRQWQEGLTEEWLFCCSQILKWLTEYMKSSRWLNFEPKFKSGLCEVLCRISLFIANLRLFLSFWEQLFSFFMFWTFHYKIWKESYVRGTDAPFLPCSPAETINNTLISTNDNNNLVAKFNAHFAEIFSHCTSCINTFYWSIF